VSDKSEYKGIDKQDILQINISLVIVILIFMLGVYKDIFINIVNYFTIYLYV